MKIQIEINEADIRRAVYQKFTEEHPSLAARFGSLSFEIGAATSIGAGQSIFACGDMEILFPE